MNSGEDPEVVPPFEVRAHARSTANLNVALDQ